MVSSVQIMGSRGERERSVQFGSIIAGYRNRLQQKTSQSEIARRIGVDSTYWSRIEGGKKHPSSAVTIAMTEALNVPEAEQAELLLRAQYPDEVIDRVLAARDAEVKKKAQEEILQRSNRSHTNPNW